jgi:hypothetical protein
MILWVVLDREDKYISIHIKLADAQSVIDNDDKSILPRGLRVIALNIFR